MIKWWRRLRMGFRIATGHPHYWKLSVFDDESHVWPMYDSTKHDLWRDECVCGPTPELLSNGDWMYVHHSLDGREAEEQ